MAWTRPSVGQCFPLRPTVLDGTAQEARDAGNRGASDSAALSSVNGWLWGVLPLGTPKRNGGRAAAVAFLRLVVGPRVRGLRHLDCGHASGGAGARTPVPLSRTRVPGPPPWAGGRLCHVRRHCPLTAGLPTTVTGMYGRVIITEHRFWEPPAWREALGGQEALGARAGESGGQRRPRARRLCPEMERRLSGPCVALAEVCVPEGRSSLDFRNMRFLTGSPTPQPPAAPPASLCSREPPPDGCLHGEQGAEESLGKLGVEGEEGGGGRERKEVGGGRPPPNKTHWVPTPHRGAPGSTPPSRALEPQTARSPFCFPMGRGRG